MLPAKRDLTEQIEFNVRVISVNDLPEIVEAPDVISVDEGDLIQFTITAIDIDLEFGGDSLWYWFLDDDRILDQGAELVDNHEGLLFVNWRTDHEDAGVYVPIIVVSDRTGDRDFTAVRINIGNVNVVPRVVQEIRDTLLVEDSEPVSLGDVSGMFVDLDGDPMQITGAGEGLRAWITQDEMLYVQPREHWNGSTILTVTANDGRGGVTSDCVQVTVTSVNDLPTSFRLASPRDGATVNTRPDIIFTWRPSYDVVEDSSIVYKLVIDSGRITFTNIRDTTAAVQRAILTPNPNIPTNIQWEVWANDGIDSVRSDERFNLIIEPLSVWESDFAMVDELELGPIYPNPFNDVVTIGYALPSATKLTLAIHDHTGRLVRTLSNNAASAGRFSVQWDGYNSYGSKVSSGVYICRLSTPGAVLMQRLVLLR